MEAGGQIVLVDGEARRQPLQIQGLHIMEINIVQAAPHGAGIALQGMPLHQQAVMPDHLGNQRLQLGRVFRVFDLRHKLAADGVNIKRMHRRLLDGLPVGGIHRDEHILAVPHLVRQPLVQGKAHEQILLIGGFGNISPADGVQHPVFHRVAGFHGGVGNRGQRNHRLLLHGFRMITGHRLDFKIRIGQVSGQQGGQQLSPAEQIMNDGNPLEIPLDGVHGLRRKAVQLHEPAVGLLAVAPIGIGPQIDHGPLLFPSSPEHQIVQAEVVPIIDHTVHRHQAAHLGRHLPVVKVLIQLIPKLEIQARGLRGGAFLRKNQQLYPVGSQDIADHVPQIHHDH